jgi:hypothetical protein
MIARATYVRNVCKCYVSCRLDLDQHAQVEKAK